MAVRLSLDTTVLIDLERERLRGAGEGPAHRFLRRSPDAQLYLSSVALGEFAEGFPHTEHPTVQIARDQHTILPIDEETALVYAGITRDLRRSGHLIGANDLWIGAVTLRHQLPLLTADESDFRRIEGLGVITYRDHATD